MKKIATLFFLVSLLGIFVGCSRDADIASYNISQDADSFKVFRRVVFYNGITDKYILEVKGYCSIDIDRVARKFTVTVKDDSGRYMKHYLGLSDNVTFFAEQIESIPESAKHYTVVFKPESIIPSIELR